jgi:formylglycine-generating enzyme required for sulfatase activity
MVVSLPGCFSPWKGDDAKFVIIFAGGAASSRAAGDGVSELQHRVELTRENEMPLAFFGKGDSIKGSAPAGQWKIGVHSIDTDGELYAEGSGYVNLQPGQENVVPIKMLRIETIAFTGLTADSSLTTTTTKLTLTFEKDIDGLSAADITLTAGSTGVVKGSLAKTNTAGVYELFIAGISAGGEVTVTVSKTGYVITGGPKAVAISAFIKTVWVDGGSFQMGSNTGNDNETPVHAVTLSGFSIGLHEVTQKQWEAVMGRTIMEQQGLAGSTAIDNGRGNDYPVYCVNWFEAVVFCNKLSMMEGLSPAYRINDSTDPDDWGAVPSSEDDENYAVWNGVTIVEGSAGYRLPTEAQWEYAAKGGDGSPGNYTYSGGNVIDDVAWYTDNTSFSPALPGWGSREAGTKAANGLGLYDMSGNVEEWCWDWYDAYPSAAQDDPAGAEDGTSRVHRGGYFVADAQSCRSTYRSGDDPGSRSGGGIVLGFRVARPLP